MINKNWLEILLGFFILGFSLISLLYIYLSYVGYNNSHYIVYAKFDNTSGIIQGAKVKISGIDIGHVNSVAMDKDFEVKLELYIKSDIKIPNESIVRIVSSSIFGGEMYIDIKPNSMSTDYMITGDEFVFCYSAFNLEGLINKFASKFIT